MIIMIKTYHILFGAFTTLFCWRFFKKNTFQYFSFQFLLTDKLVAFCSSCGESRRSWYCSWLDDVHANDWYRCLFTCRWRYSWQVQVRLLYLFILLLHERFTWNLSTSIFAFITKQHILLLSFFLFTLQHNFHYCCIFIILF